MVAPDQTTRGRKRAIVVAQLAFADSRFTRADLVFDGVDHTGPSYEVLVFLNNPNATDTTAHETGRGYAGRFVIFGHGGCFGELGHCDVPIERPAHDLRPVHPLTPAIKLVTVTDALRHVVARDGSLSSVTLVPIEQAPRRADRKVSPDVFRFTNLELRTYLSGTDNDLPAQS